MPSVICFVGRPHIGKTTILESVIPELTRRGYRIAAVKHSMGAHELDQPGKNSWRLRQTGAGVVLAVTPEQTAEFRVTPTPVTLEEIVARYADYDIVISEGFMGSPYPTVEVLRSDIDTELHASEEHRVAVVSDVPVEVRCRQFTFDETEALTDFLEETVIKGERPGG